LKPYIELLRKKGGFSWVFKTQIYSPGFEQLRRTLYKRLELPVSVRTELPEKTIDFRQMGSFYCKQVKSKKGN
jgi:hypothetical protein